MKCSKHVDHEAAGVCSYSGKAYCAEELIELDGRFYGKDCLITLAGSREQRRLPQAETLTLVVLAVAGLVFSICVYAFFLGNGFFERKFSNDPIAWYFLAKGIFCSVSLYLTQALLVAVRNL
jgi:hypothetical protein